jgi:hypothetical protein
MGAAMSAIFLEESRKSWDHAVSNKLIYSLDPIEVALNSIMGVAKDNLEGHVWIELHMTFQCGFEAQRDVHYAAFIESGYRHDAGRKSKIDNCSMNGNSPVLVNYAHLVETPQKVHSGGINIPSVVRLKRFDNGHCICGYSQSLPVKSLHIDLLKNWELSVFGIALAQCGQTPNELLQRSSEAVENLTDDKRNLVGNIGDLNTDMASLMFRVISASEFARIRLSEQAQLVPQSFQMFLRPRALQKGIS